MNAVLTEPGVCRSALWGLVWFGMDFQELVFPDLGSLDGITAKESKSSFSWDDLSGEFMSEQL